MSLTLDSATSTVLHDVSWGTYRQLRADAGRATRMTFDHGRLEIMPPISMGHGRRTDLLARLIEAYMEHADVAFECVDVVTLAREDQLRGCEGDRMYYVRAEPPALDVEDLDLAIHNAPDIVIEVDLASRSIDKEPLYAAFGVREPLRLDRDRLHLRRVNAAGDGFTDAADSGLLPELDVRLLREHAALRAVVPQREIVARWRAALRH